MDKRYIIIVYMGGNRIYVGPYNSEKTAYAVAKSVKDNETGKSIYCDVERLLTDKQVFR